MTYTLHRADRYTHAKIVTVALSFVAAIVIVGVNARSSDVLMDKVDGASHLSERKLGARVTDGRAISSKGDRLTVRSSTPNGERIARNTIGINTTSVAKTLPAAEQRARHSTPSAGPIRQLPPPSQRKLIACELAFSPFTTFDEREVYARCFARLLSIAAQESA
jgi:hypothetical protein